MKTIFMLLAVCFSCCVLKAQQTDTISDIKILNLARAPIASPPASDLPPKKGFNFLALYVHGSALSSKIGQQDTRELEFYSGVGYSVGLAFRVNLHPIYLEAAFDYSNRRTKLGFADDSKRVIQFDALEVPVVVGYNIWTFPCHGSHISEGRMRVFAGLVCASTLNDDIEHNGELFDFENNLQEWKVGAGIDIDRYSIDLSYAGGDSPFGSEYKNSHTLGLTVSCRLLRYK